MTLKELNNSINLFDLNEDILNEIFIEAQKCSILCANCNHYRIHTIQYPNEELIHKNDTEVILFIQTIKNKVIMVLILKFIFIATTKFN